MPDMPARSGFTLGFTVTLVVTLLLYAMTVATVAGSRSSDPAGNAMAAGFAAIFAAVLWLGLVVLLLLARSGGAMPRGAGWALLAVVPVAVVVFYMALDGFSRGDSSALVLVVLLPGLLTVYALWARVPGLQGVLRPVPTSAVLLSSVGLLSLFVLGVSLRAALPDPERDARYAAVEKARLEEVAKQERETRERDARDFAALGQDSFMGDYLIYLHASAFEDRALEGIRKVQNRQLDAVTLMEKLPLAELADLWQFNLVPTREICEAYGNALTAAVNRIDKSNSNYLGNAIDIEWQLPNIKWLLSAKCDLSGPLERAATYIRAVADSDRLRNFADTLTDLRTLK
jgi:hypothetical protein